MRRLDLDLLQTLVTVADVGSLSAAAPRLFRSQSAISEQIRKLEEMCGVPLLSRGKKGASLTPAGERLLTHARKLLALNDIAYQDMQGVLLAGDLRLAITDYFRPTVIAGILKRLRAQYPRLRLHVSIRKSALIEQDAGAHDFDIGLSMRILEDPARQALDDRKDGRLRLRRESLSWVADPTVTMDSSARLPLLVLPETCSMQRFIVKTLDAHDVPYVVTHSASGVGGLHLALLAGLGVSCLNASAIPSGISRFDGGLKLPPLPEVEFSLLPPRPGEMALVTEVREMLAAELR
jgi:DNA-binding transcriptional LysR family regulator